MYVLILFVFIVVCVGLCYWGNHCRKARKDDSEKYLGRDRETKKDEEKAEASPIETSDDKVRREYEIQMKKVVCQGKTIAEGRGNKVS
jgi:uncharacterized ion transporter superfamily protein YfcC